MAELIKKTDNLNQGREKLNEAIKDAETAKGTSAQADDKATEALAKSESTQTQLDTIVIEGDSSVEAAQARVDERGESHTTLKARIDDGFTSVKTQLAETVGNIQKISVTGRPQNKRKIIYDLPLKFPDWETIKLSEGSGTFFPRQMFVRDKEDMLFIQYANTTARTTWVVVYKWTSGQYLSCFKLDGSYNTHGFVVQKRGNKLLYIIPDALDTGFLHEYDISTLPPNKASISPIKIYSEISNLDQYIGYSNGSFLTKDVRSGEFYLYNDDFHSKSSFTLDGLARVTLDRDITYQREITKGQGIALGSDFLVIGVGTGSRGGSKKEDQQGFLVLNHEGSLLFSNVYTPENLIGKLSAQGLDVNYIEVEGISVDSEDNIYSLIVYSDAEAINSSTGGLLIVEELSFDSSSIDMSDISEPFKTFDFDSIIGKNYPKNGGRYYNPVTGEQLKNVKDVCDMMFKYKIDHLYFYSFSNDDFRGVDGESLSGSTIHDLRRVSSTTIRGTEISGYTTSHFTCNAGKAPEYRSLNLKKIDITGLRPLNIDTNVSFEIPSGLRSIEFEFNVTGGDGQIRQFDSAGNRDFIINLSDIDNNKNKKQITFYEFKVVITNLTITVERAIKFILSDGNIVVEDVKDNSVFFRLYAY